MIFKFSPSKVQSNKNQLAMSDGADECRHWVFARKVRGFLKGIVRAAPREIVRIGLGQSAYGTRGNMLCDLLSPSGFHPFAECCSHHIVVMNEVKP